MSYTHEELTGDSDIRVLKLLPFGRSRQSPLSLELITTQVRTPDPNSTTGLKFEALSYAWEGQTPNRALLCHGKKLLVTANCEAALYQLRHRTRSRLLWIDSICINQTSDTEKSQQVQMMGSIYQQAEQVIVWLGHGSPQIANVFSRLETLKKVSYISSYPIRRRLEPLLASRIDKMQSDRSTVIEDTGSGTRADEHEDLVLRDIFSRTWFKRMWTLQEVVLSRKCTVQCGDASTPWETLTSLDRYFLSTGKGMGLERVDDPAIIHRELAEKLRSTSHQSDNMYSAREIALLLGSTQGKEVTDPRDRIFALHGIFRAAGLHLPPPDYSKNVLQVFRETTVAAIKEDKSLTVLHYAPGAANGMGEPSWVPNWGDPNPAWVPARLLHHCTGDSSVQFEFSSDERQLYLWGKRIDRIDVCAPPIPPVHASNISENLVVELITAIQQWIQLAVCSTKEQTCESVYEDFLVTILWNSHALRTQIEDNYATWLEILLRGMDTGTESRLETFQRLVQARVEYKWSIARPAAQRIPTRPSASESQHSSKESSILHTLTTNPAARSHHDVFTGTNRSRRLFFTEKRRIGTGTAGVAAGDEIVLFAGAKQPMIVRRNSEGNYRFLGNAYVHGVMSGEAWEQPGGGVSELSSALWDVTLRDADKLERFALV